MKPEEGRMPALFSLAQSVQVRVVADPHPDSGKSTRQTAEPVVPPLNLAGSNMRSSDDRQMVSAPARLPEFHKYINTYEPGESSYATTSNSEALNTVVRSQQLTIQQLQTQMEAMRVEMTRFMNREGSILLDDLPAYDQAQSSSSRSRL